MVLRAAMIPPLFRAPLLLAGAACVAAPLLLASGERAQPPQAVSLTPQAVSLTPQAVAPATRSYAYYPEQLAALSSLNGFQPLADPGRPAITATTPAQSPGPAQDALAARRIARAEGPHRAALVSVAAATPTAAPQAEPEAKSQAWSLFGVNLPRPGWPDGDALRRQADNLRDAASGQATALGDHLAHLWR